MSAQPPLIVIETGRGIEDAVVFSSNGEYILSAGYEEVQMWRVKDGERMATMRTEWRTLALAVSKDGKWIAAGTTGPGGRVYVWDANTYEQAFTLQNDDGYDTNSVDFSPDSTRLVSGSDDRMVTVWDVATRQRVLGPFEHENSVCTVKYSPQGDRIATASYGSIRVYDSNDGRLLINISIPVSPLYYSQSFVWSKNQLFIVTYDKIMQIEASTGSTILEQPVPSANAGLAIALPHHAEFFVYSAEMTVMFWDTSMHSQLGLIRHTWNVGSMAFSPDDRLLAISEQSSTKIFIHDVTRGAVPFMDIPDAALDPWKEDQLTDIDKLLTRTITTSADQPSHHAYANRALIRARLGRWDAAIEDAEKSIKVQPSVIGYIAKSVALIGGGNKEKVSCVYDLASRHIQLYDGVDPLLLIKAVVLFMAGEHDEAMSRIDDLITTLHSNLICYVVLAYMHLLLGDSHMGNDYEGAIRSYERARTQMCSYAGPFLRTIAFISGWKFDGLGITIKQRLCEALYAAGRIKEAGETLVEMVNVFDEEVYVRGSVSKWVSDFIHRYISAPEGKWVVDFKPRCAEKMVHFGDAAAGTQRHDDAVAHYSAALSLEPAVPQDILLKRSKARAAMGLWEDALSDANEVITLDPSLPWGYERKYVALGVAGLHKDKSDALETMLSKMAQSDDPAIRERGQQYPKTQETIRGVIQGAIRDLPPVLISVTSGRLCDKSEQAISFELSPRYAELASTMTTKMDLAHIEREVADYYRYSTFSHKYEINEPRFEEVINTVLYDLKESPTHDKLQTFCKIVRDAGFHWAWSSTCCIDTVDSSALQEALASMFRWYQESALTIIHLLDVCSPSQRGDLVRSIWNTRAWMFQEYHASKVVRFYNSDWTLYRNLDVPNHKESPEIVSEIVEATGIPTGVLTAFRPGLGNIREKLYLASRRETSLVEDAAYSLFGIFSLSLPVVYGEGDKALGHLLSQLLTKSRDTSILVWTGTSGSFNSCLPSNITVFHELWTSHVQPAIVEDEVDEVATGLRASSLNIAFLTKLIDRLKELPAPWFAGQEMKLPCLTLKLGPVSSSGTNLERIFHVQTAALGDVEIKTHEDLSRFESLYLVHPWIDFLLDRPLRSGRETHEEESDYEGSVQEMLAFPSRPHVPLAALVQARAARFVIRLKRFRRGRSESPPPIPAPLGLPMLPSQGNKQMKAVRFAARLRRPFEALLLARDGGGKYRRVAANSRIMVQMVDITAPVLKQLVDGVRVLDVL